MSLSVRVIPCLDVDAGRVVKGVNFVELADVGDPVELAAMYGHQGADELVFLDITASSGGRDTMYDVVRRTAAEVFIPLTVGGGVNTAALGRPELLSEAAQRFGAQCVVLSVDTRRSSDQPSGFEVTTHGGRRSAGRDALEWVAQAAELGAGEILLNSMDADGTKEGYDLELTAQARAVCDLPIIASGGAGKLSDFAPAVAAGADALLAASVFHFGTLTIPQVKSELSGAGYPVRQQVA
jgi:cyclase